MAHENGGPMLANDKMRPPMPPAETLSPPRGDIPGVEDFLDETKVLLHGEKKNCFSCEAPL